jgi:hypothetical protein
MFVPRVGQGIVANCLLCSRTVKICHRELLLTEKAFRGAVDHRDRAPDVDGGGKSMLHGSGPLFFHAPAGGGRNDTGPPHFFQVLFVIPNPDYSSWDQVRAPAVQPGRQIA